jgi:predicted transcriptional regulator
MPRITIRLDDDLYDRLVLFAKGRGNGEVAELSTLVREALEQYLSPKPRQTKPSDMRRRYGHYEP